MLRVIIGSLLIGASALRALPTAAQDAQQYVRQYFTGAAMQYGRGSGTSSNNQRYELNIHYCASGSYFTSGRACRPNIVAKGYQCTPYQDAGRWQIGGQGGRAFIQWRSRGGGQGSMALGIRRDGIVIDDRGNPFVRVGRAQCR